MTEYNNLSEREIEVLTLVSQGLSNKEIARELFISINTVKVHLRNIFAKINVMSRTEATLYAIENGIVKSPGPELITIVEAEAVEPSRWQKLWQRFWWAVIPLGLGLILGLAMVIGRSPIFATPTPESFESLAETQRWQELAPMPEARAGLAAAAYDNAIYAIAGETEEGPSGLVERYDPQTDSWTRLRDKPTPVTYVSAVLMGEKIYVPGGELVGGLPTDVLEVYDPRNDNWETKAPLPQAVSGYALAAHEGQMYLFGGWDGEKALDNVYIYDPNDDRWREGTPLPTARAYAGAAEAGGKIYVVGGWDGEKALDVNESYSPSRDREGEQAWAKEPKLAENIFGDSAISIAEMIFSLGESGVWQYNGQEDRWILIGTDPLAFEGKQTCLAANEGYIYLLGGRSNQADILNSNLRYQAIYTIGLPLITK